MVYQQAWQVHEPIKTVDLVAADTDGIKMTKATETCATVVRAKRRMDGWMDAWMGWHMLDENWQTFEVRQTVASEVNVSDVGHAAQPVTVSVFVVFLLLYRMYQCTMYQCINVYTWMPPIRQHRQTANKSQMINQTNKQNTHSQHNVRPAHIPRRLDLVHR